MNFYANQTLNVSVRLLAWTQSLKEFAWVSLDALPTTDPCQRMGSKVIFSDFSLKLKFLPELSHLFRDAVQKVGMVDVLL